MYEFYQFTAEIISIKHEIYQSVLSTKMVCPRNAIETSVAVAVIL